MREIEFRGKLDGADKWVYGYYYGGYNWADFIISNEGFEHRQRVMHETIGQYTGLKDKNGTKIFEGDMVVYTLNHDSSQRESKSIIEWHNHAWRLNRIWLLTEIRFIEVIGNIHDNPELLKGE